MKPERMTARFKRAIERRSTPDAEWSRLNRALNVISPRCSDSSRRISFRNLSDVQVNAMLALIRRYYSDQPLTVTIFPTKKDPSLFDLSIKRGFGHNLSVVDNRR